MKFPLLLSLTSVATLTISALVLAKPESAPLIGLQLYSLRDSFKADVPGTLDKVKALGIHEVEIANLQGMKVEDFKEALGSRGMKAISGHWPFERLDADPAGVAAEAKAMGCTYVACAWIPHDNPVFSEADARKGIAVFNKAGAVMKQNGLSFCYHAHGYEFQPFGEGTLFDLMAKEMIPGTADFQMDVFWIVHPGQDPVKLLDKYPGRFKTMHLKDWKKGSRGNLQGHAPNEESVACGEGVVNWPAVLAAAKKAGVEHYFIEDEAAAVESQLPVTIKYLKGLGMGL